MLTFAEGPAAFAEVQGRADIYDNCFLVARKLESKLRGGMRYRFENYEKYYYYASNVKDTARMHKASEEECETPPA